MTNIPPTRLGMSHSEFALARLLLADPIGREELVVRTGIPKATCARLLDGLAEKGWARRVGLADSTGGRRRLLWRAASKTMVAAGLLIEVDKATAALVDLTGEVLESSSRKLTVGVSGEDFAGDVAAPLREVVRHIGKASDRLLGVGVTAPGLVDRAGGALAGCSYFSKTSWWRGFPLLARLRDSMPSDYFLDTHTNAAMLGEHWFGANRSVADMIYIDLEMQGIGAGFLMDGKPFRGFRGAAGEFGHMTIDYEGRLCRCGGRGCMDAYVSGSEIVRKAVEIRRAGGQSTIFEGLAADHAPTAADVMRAATGGDHIASSILEETGGFLGIGIGNLVNLLNPELVILGGELAGGGTSLLDPIRRVVGRMALEKDGRQPRIVCSALTSRGNAVGAAALVLHDIFGSPWARP